MLCCALLCAPAHAVERKPVAVVVIASNIGIHDISSNSLPNLRRLLENGCCALMSVRTGRPTKDVETSIFVGMEAGCVSLGAGALGIGGTEARRAADADGDFNGISAARLYTYSTGRTPENARVLHLEAIRLQKANAGSSYKAQPGALGSALRAAGIRTAAIGNSDIPGEAHREFVAAIMDRNGLVDYGCVSAPGLTETSVGSPYGLRTNTERLLGEFDRIAGTARCVVIDFGDTLRADRYAEMCSDNAAARVKREAIRSLDCFLGKLLRRLDPDIDLLMLVSPAPPLVSELDDERLTPVIAAGPAFRRGVLTSGSTRRAGVVTISDVAPTLTTFFSIQTPAQMVGRPMRASSSKQTWRDLLELDITASRQAGQMVIMRGSSVVQSGVVIIVTIAVLVGVSGWWRRAAGYAALLAASLPLAMLYLPLFHPPNIAAAIAMLAALQVALLLLCAGVFKSPRRAFVWLCGALATSIIADVARGSVLISSSIAGYSFAEGARYYGIGNELMGTLLGAVIVGTGMALSACRLGERARELLTIGVFGAAFVAIGAPSLGANTGGAMAALPGMAVVLVRRRGWRLTGRVLLLIVVLMMVVIGGILAFDALRSGESQSHMGRAADLVGGNPLGLLSIFQRKLALNFMLLSTSLWSRLLLVSLAGAAALFWWGRRVLGKAVRLGVEESAAAIGCLAAAVAAFAFNDSGVVAAACCSVFLWALMALRG